MFFLLFLATAATAAATGADHWSLLADQHSGGVSLVGAGVLEAAPARCVPMPANLTLCQGVGYGRMRLPNLLEHANLAELLHQAASWLPLVSIGCHPEARLFLCTLFAPVCVEPGGAAGLAQQQAQAGHGLAQAIYPCRSLCQGVQAGCEARMAAYGYPWPDMLRCDKFPRDNDMCIASQRQGASQDSNSCSACQQVDTFENLVDHYCRSNFVVKARFLENRPASGGSHLRIDKRRTRLYKDGGWKKRDFRRQGFHLDGHRGCGCGSIQARGDMLVMGSISGNRARASLIVPFDRRKKQLRRAARMFRKKIQCNKLPKLLDKQLTRIDGNEKSEQRSTPRPSENQSGSGVRKENKRQREKKLTKEEKRQRRLQRRRERRQRKAEKRRNRARVEARDERNHTG